MLFFFADNHYGVNPGRGIYSALPEELRRRITFAEDDWTLLESGDWVEKCELLILDMIGDTCGVEHPGSGAEEKVRRYLEQGGNVLLLHGSSAAFWKWEWWRKIVGLRWVRPGDPDGVAPSVHPAKPFVVRPCKVRHPLMASLRELSLPADEIYISLEQVSPVTVLMETQIEEGVFPQCFENITPWGGRFCHFLPGHAPEVTGNPQVAATVSALAAYLLGE